MKKILLFLAVFIPLLIPRTVLAKVILQEQGMVTVAKSEVIDDDLFVGAENVSIDGTVKGSLFVGAGNITVTGTIAGDIIAGTGNLTLTGAQVGGNIIAGAGQINIDDKSKISGSLIAGTGNLQNSAPVGRSVMIGAGTAYLNGAVGKEMRFGGGSLELGPQAKIAGDLTYALGEEQGEYIKSDTATIAGTVNKITPPVRDWDKAKADASKAGMAAQKGFLIFSYLGALIIGFIFVKLFPRTLEGLSKQIHSALAQSLGIGFLIVILILPVLLVLALTIIGLPLVGLLIPLLILDFYAAKLVSAFALGELIAKQFSWNKIGMYTKFFTGLTVFYFLRALPAAGWIITMLFTWTGLGAIWLYTRSHLKSL